MKTAVLSLLCVLLALPCHGHTMLSNPSLLRLPRPDQVLDTFLLPMRDYLYIQARQAMRAERSPHHHVWQMPMGVECHWTRASNASALHQRSLLFRVTSTVSPDPMTFSLVFDQLAGQEQAPLPTMSLAQFISVQWPAISSGQSLHVRWPTPSPFTTYWIFEREDHWSSQWQAPDYGLNIALSRRGNTFQYSCNLMCWSSGPVAMAQEAKAVFVDEIYPRYFLDGTEVAANQFYQWLNQVFLFTIKQSAEYFVNQFFAPNVSGANPHAGEDEPEEE